MKKKNRLQFCVALSVLIFLLISAKPFIHNQNRVINKTQTLLSIVDSIEIKINQIANYYMSDSGNVGLIIGIFRQRTDPNIPVAPEIFSYGRLRKEQNSPAPDSLTLFKLASVEKTFCATMLAKILLDSSLNVSIHDRMNEYLPDTLMLPRWIDTRTTPHDTVYISLLDLVTHYSSLPNDPTNLVEPPGYTFQMLFEFLESYHDSLHPRPGTHWRYSNLGFGLLGDINSFILDTPYSSAANSIFNSLGMVDTKIVVPPEDTNRVAPGHSSSGHLIKHYLRPPSISLEGAGAHFSTMKDMLHFLSFNLGMMETPLNNTLDTLHKWRMDRNQNIHKGQAMAWEIDLLYPNSNMYHIWKDGGSPDGYSTFITFRPETKTGVVVLSNSRNAVDSVGNVVLRILNPLSTGISLSGNSIPESFQLYQNFPNPFNPLTTIRFDIAKSNLVKLSVYDVSGRIVSSLVNERLNGGSYTFRFDASDIPSGVYFYRLETPDYSETKKLTLIK